jgi:hypothetical protein
VSTDSDGTTQEGMTELGGEDDDPALAGLAAAVGSVFLTLSTALLVADRPLAVFRDASGNPLNIGIEPVLGWTFLAAHGVPVQVASERWELAGALVQSPVVYAVPPVTLAVGGYLVTRLDEQTDAISGARTGVLITIGYALVAAIAALGTRVSVQSSYASISAAPDLVFGLAIGVVYPVVFGGIGGAVAGLVHGRLGDIPRRAEAVVIAGVGVALAVAVGTEML